MKRAALILLMVACSRHETPSPVARHDAPIAGRPTSRDAASASTPSDPGDQGYARLERITHERTLALDVATAETQTVETDTEHCNKVRHDEETRLGCFSCELAMPADVPADALAGMTRAIEETPASMLSAAGVRRLVLCKKLELRSGRSDVIAGTVQHDTGAIYVSLEKPSFQFARLVFHHELFHLFDWNTDPQEHHRKDFAWKALNDDGVYYGETDHLLDGFVDVYAQTNAVEDRASTFARAFSAPEDVCGRFGKDRVVQAKFQMLADRVRAAIGDRDAGYFAERLRCAP